ncbi:MAG TPA: T9SS type A sorting domain-containing protein, partial [Bacteroidales bacterium]|nr:T9SS type A sorting domain-containing protein [Bacteroidales bacterium]
PAFELPGTAVVDVYAENRFDTKRYLVHYTVFTGVEDKVVPSIQVYPNPVTNVLHVNGMKDAGVKLFNTSGEQVLTLNKFSGSTIDVSELPSGVYIMNVTTADGQTMRRKIVVY